MAAGVAVEAPVLTWLAIGLLFMVSWAVAFGLRVGWIYTFGAMLTLMADALNYDKWVVHIHLGGPFEAINRTVLNTLGRMEAAGEHGMGYFFHGAAILQEWGARELLHLGSEVFAWATWFQNSHLPRWVKGLIYAAVPPALLLRLITAAIHANIPALARRIVTRVEHVSVVRTIRIVAATAGHLALPPFVLRLPHRLGRLEHQLDTLWRRLRGLEKYAGATGAVALFVAALSKLGMHWLRCSNVAKTAKALCRTNIKWLENALLGLVAVIGTLSLLDLGESVYVLMGDFVGEVRHFWRADVSRVAPNPGLGELGAPRVLSRPADYVQPNPGLGEVA